MNTNIFSFKYHLITNMNIFGLNISAFKNANTNTNIIELENISEYECKNYSLFYEQQIISYLNIFGLTYSNLFGLTHLNIFENQIIC